MMKHGGKGGGGEKDSCEEHLKLLCPLGANSLLIKWDRIIYSPTGDYLIIVIF